METLLRFLLVATLLSSALSQQQYTINPNSVPLSTRQQWCSSQDTQCPFICLQVGNALLETRQNDCSAVSLTYTCVCQNGISPNISQYSLTLPYFICQEWGNQCVANCGLDSTCASSCRQKHPCGAQDPRRGNKTVASASRSASAARAASKTKAATAHTGFANGADGDSGAGMVTPPALFVLSGNGGLTAVCSAFFLAFAIML